MSQAGRRRFSGSVLNSVVVPAFGRVGADGPRLGRALVTSSLYVALLAFPIGALTLALSQPLISTVFGQKWADAAPVLAILSIYGVLYAFSLLYVNVLVATGKTMRLLVIQLIWIAVLVPAILIGVQKAGLQGVAWAHVVTIAVVALPAYLISVLRVTKVSLSQIGRRVFAPGVAAVLAGVTAWIITAVFEPRWLWAFLLGGTLGSLVYMIAVSRPLTEVIPERFVPHWIPDRLKFNRGSPIE